MCRTVVTGANVLELIGNTPMIKLGISPNKNVEIYAKVEGLNPGGSIKDRPALRMIEEAEKQGVLTNNKTIIEATSGNMGIALAMIAAVKGYKMTAVMSEGASIERKQIMSAYGATIILTPSKKGTDGAIAKLESLMKKYPNKYFRPDQFANKNNPMAHYGTTAEEIIEQLGEEPDFIVAGMGTSGTLMGLTQRIKKDGRKTKIIGIEPRQGHKIQGLKNMTESKVPAIYDEEILDEKISLENEEAFNMMKILSRKEGLLVGMSSGAAVAGAIRKARKIKSGKIVAILPDRGDRYLSTGVFD